MSGAPSLGKVLGIPIRLHTTWFVVAVLVTASLAAGFFPRQYGGWSPATYWLVGAVTAVLFFGSVLLHELGHSVVALRERVPVKSITLFIFGGVAQIGVEPPTAGAEFRVAVAGPLVSFALAAIFTGLGAILSRIDFLFAPLAYLGLCWPNIPIRRGSSQAERCAYTPRQAFKRNPRTDARFRPAQWWKGNVGKRLEAEEDLALPFHLLDVAASAVTATLTTILMGTLSDRTRGRWGRRRPFILGGYLAWGGV
jgi:hypothetical protein